MAIHLQLDTEGRPLPKRFVKIWYRPGFLRRRGRRRGMRVEQGNQQIWWALQYSDHKFRLCDKHGAVLSNKRGDELWVDVEPEDSIRVRAAKITVHGNLKLDRPRKKRRKQDGTEVVVPATACPRCGADADNPCMTSGGKPIKKFHNERPEVAPPTIRDTLLKALDGEKSEVTDRAVFVSGAISKVTRLLIANGWSVSFPEADSTEASIVVRGLKAKVKVTSAPGNSTLIHVSK